MSTSVLIVSLCLPLAVIPTSAPQAGEPNQRIWRGDWQTTGEFLSCTDPEGKGRPRFIFFSALVETVHVVTAGYQAAPVNVLSWGVDLANNYRPC